LPGGRRVGRVDGAEHDAWLERAVPLIDLEPNRDVEPLGGRRRGEATVDAECHAERATRPAREGEARVALAASHRPYVGEPGAREERLARGIPRAEGPEPVELLGALEPEALAAAPRVDPLARRRRLGAERRRGALAERPRESFERAGLDLEPGRRPMPAVAQ